MDCSFANNNDKLTVQLWRKVNFLPDDHWVTDTDPYAPDWDTNTYFASAGKCEDPGISDDYVNKSYFDGDHSIDASVSSGILSPCG